MIGGTVARLSVAAGHHVVLSNSRGPATLADLAAGLGPLARAGSGQDAAAQSDIVVVSIPFRACQSVPAGPLDGKLVLDTCNYYPERDGHIGVLDDGLETSSELLQRHLAGADVVKAFNNIFFKHLLSLSSRPGPPTGRSCRSRATRPRPRGKPPAIWTPSATAASTPAPWLTAGGRNQDRRCTGRLTARSATRAAIRPARTSSARRC